MEDITPLFIYISSCDKYYRENGHGKITTISIFLSIPGFNKLMFGESSIYDNRCDDLGEHRISDFKRKRNALFSSLGFCARYMEPFRILIEGTFKHFRTEEERLEFERQRREIEEASQSDLFSLVEDITPLFIYISSCDKYYRENGHGKIATINICLYISNFKRLMFGEFGTFDDVFNDLGEHRIAIFKKRLNESFSRVGYCMRYIEPFKIRISTRFIHFPTLINYYKIFKLEECVICLEKEPKVLFCNCGHICICEKCILHRYDNCPVCKEKSTILRIIE